MSKAKSTKLRGTLTTRGKKKYYYLRHYIDKKQVIQKLLDTNGKPISDKKDAVKAQEALLAPLMAKAPEQQLEAVKAKLEGIEKRKSPSKPSLLLSKVWGAYNRAGNRPKSGEATLNRYKTVIEAFTKWIGKAYPEIVTMRDVSIEHVEGYARHLESNKLSPSSFNIYLNNLSTVWATLAEKGDIMANPFAWDKATRTGIQRMNIKAETNVRKKRALTLEEVNTVIKKAEGDYRTLLIILVCTGQRLVDGLKLQWEEIDLQQGIITLTPQKTSKRTGKQVYIPILPQLRQELETLMHGSPYVLPELVKAYDRDPSIISKAIRAIFTKAKLTAHKQTNLKTSKAIVETGAHSLRHSFVSIARLAGIPDAVIQTITGHESVEMVDHYTAITPETIKNLSAAMPTAMLTDGEKKEPMPEWIREKLEAMNSKNWNATKKELLEVK